MRFIDDTNYARLKGYLSVEVRVLWRNPNDFKNNLLFKIESITIDVGTSFFHYTVLFCTISDYSACLVNDRGVLMIHNYWRKTLGILKKTMLTKMSDARTI